MEINSLLRESSRNIDFKNKLLDHLLSSLTRLGEVQQGRFGLRSEGGSEQVQNCKNLFKAGVRDPGFLVAGIWEHQSIYETPPCIPFLSHLIPQATSVCYPNPTPAEVS